MEQRLAAIAEALGHRPRDRALIDQACTHASASVEGERDSNERLEFLGDALLGAAVAETLYHRHPQVNEGGLSRARSHLVSRATLARALDRRGLTAHCRVGPQTPAPWAVSIRANLAEAILAAIYLDGGWLALRTAVDRLLAEDLAQAPVEPLADWKNRLQEWALATIKQLPDYRCERSGGSDHEPVFTATVGVGDYQATATGGSRRKAETAAARLMVESHCPDPGAGI